MGGEVEGRRRVERRRTEDNGKGERRRKGKGKGEWATVSK